MASMKREKKVAAFFAVVDEMKKSAERRLDESSRNWITILAEINFVDMP